MNARSRWPLVGTSLLLSSVLWVASACGDDDPPPGDYCEDGECVCSGADCVCPGSGDCRLSCEADCNLNCTGSGNCDFACAAGCNVGCKSNGQCLVAVGDGSTVSCTGSGDCTVSCAGDCKLACPGGATCIVSCPVDATCEITNCEQVQTCPVDPEKPENRFVCNGSC